MPFHLARLFFSDFLHSPIPCLSETHRTLLSSFSHILVTKICSENNLWSLPKTECLPREITPFSSIVSKNVSVWSSALYIHPFLKSIRSALSCYKSNQLPISGIGLELIWKGGGGGGVLGAWWMKWRTLLNFFQVLVACVSFWPANMNGGWFIPFLCLRSFRYSTCGRSKKARHIYSYVPSLCFRFCFFFFCFFFIYIFTMVSFSFDCSFTH